MIPLERSDNPLDIRTNLGREQKGKGYLNEKSWEEGPNPYIQDNSKKGKSQFKIKLDNATQPIKN